eukprot:CAMPEP_0114260364 /NCGR_PEP_ID=MMETSP0058-20121206/20447_1 /TAXON_ID=36894 /ORGANISM="Pyramimonas parkeae, CCMP726" /LENGTH=253 /DNA_ID=CAMNT_0001375593 /DNA_START=207 /DNA_END=968 /DNA_ORIENTATION=+
MEVSVNLPVRAVDAVLAAVIFREVAKFVLYFQNQSPGPYDDMLRTVQELEAEAESQGAVRARRSRTRNRRLLQFVRSAEAIFSSVRSETLAACKATDLLLVLGASPARPKMACQIHLGDSSLVVDPPADGEPPWEEVTEKQAKDCGRRVVRSLISAAADGPMASGASKLFVLMRAPATETPPANFLPKRCFKAQWKMRRRTVDPIRIMFKCSQQSCKGIETTDPYVPAIPLDYIWYQSRVFVRGMPVPAAGPL